MKRFMLILGILVGCLLISTTAFSETKVDNNNQPTVNKDGSKWQIAYCESENFITYSQTLAAIINGLYEKGWIDNLEGFNEVAASGDSRLIRIGCLIGK